MNATNHQTSASRSELNKKLACKKLLQSCWNYLKKSTRGARVPPWPSPPCSSRVYRQQKFSRSHKQNEPFCESSWCFSQANRTAVFFCNLHKAVLAYAALKLDSAPLPLPDWCYSSWAEHIEKVAFWLQYVLSYTCCACAKSAPITSQWMRFILLLNICKAST